MTSLRAKSAKEEHANLAIRLPAMQVVPSAEGVQLWGGLTPELDEIAAEGAHMLALGKERL